MAFTEWLTSKKPLLQPEPLSETLTIANLQHGIKLNNSNLTNNILHSNEKGTLAPNLQVPYH